MSHSKHHDIFENRKEFQLERVILFSDAVFAIAITLLILEIKLPDKEIRSMAEFTDMLGGIALDFIAFVLSFAIIGLFWTTHHRLFGYVTDFDAKLLWLNLHILFWIVVMPFTTRLNMQHGDMDIVWFLYSLNLAFVSFAFLLIWNHINKNKKLSYVSDDRNIMKYGRLRSLSTTLIFFLGGSIIFLPWAWAKWASHFSFFLIFFAMSIIRKRYNSAAKIKSGTI